MLTEDTSGDEEFCRRDDGVLTSPIGLWRRRILGLFNGPIFDGNCCCGS